MPSCMLTMANILRLHVLLSEAGLSMTAKETYHVHDQTLKTYYTNCWWQQGSRKLIDGCTCVQGSVALERVSRMIDWSLVTSHLLSLRTMVILAGWLGLVLRSWRSHLERLPSKVPRLRHHHHHVPSE